MRRSFVALAAAALLFAGAGLAACAAASGTGGTGNGPRCPGPTACPDCGPGRPCGACLEKMKECREKGTCPGGAPCGECPIRKP